jgi:hypothetical protein
MDMRRELLGMLLLAAAVATHAETSGSCSITAGRTDEKLSINWDQGDCVEGGHCHEGSSDMLWSRWTGIEPHDLQREGAAIDARRLAEPGEMRCVGKVHDGALRGVYSFIPDAQFAKRMEAMGFDGQTPDRLQGYAMLDITIAWVKELKDAHVADMTAQNLAGLKALNVDGAYVRGMVATGYPELRAEKLISMKAVGVSPEKVRAVRAMGYSPTEEELIQMSVFKIDAPFVERMKERGFKDLTIAQLVKIKVFKLDE